MSIIVTGATGHLGRLVVDHLIARGVAPTSIVAAGRDKDRLAKVAETGVATAVIDYTDPATLDAAFAGADTLVLVSSSEVGQRAAQHANAVEAAQRAGIARVVYTSAPGATTSALILAPEHKATEEIITASGLTYTILRNNWYNENYSAALAQAKQTGAYLASTGAGKVSSASRNDFAEAIAAVLTTPGHDDVVYELAGDTSWDGDHFAAAATAALGVPVAHQSVRPEEHGAILASVGLDAGLVGFLVALDANIRDGLLDGPTSVLSDLIGRPTTPLADTLREEAARLS
jgi:NAD(P)H dehydrogenase (quinone)